MERSYKDLKAWQLAFRLVTLIYKYTAEFPSVEQYRLTSQMCRAAISITGNIAEGSCQGTDKNYARFLYLSRGSAAELENYILLAKELGYMNTQRADSLLTMIEEVGRMLNGLIRYLETGKPARRLQSAIKERRVRYTVPNNTRSYPPPLGTSD